VFLYRDVLRVELGAFEAVRAKRPPRVPVVLTRGEVERLIQAVDGEGGNPWASRVYGTMARLLYGGGLRLMECCRLRVKDVDLDRGQVVVRSGKGEKDRVAMLPGACAAAMRTQLKWRRQRHEADLAAGVGLGALAVCAGGEGALGGAVARVAVCVCERPADAVAGGAAVDGGAGRGRGWGGW